MKIAVIGARGMLGRDLCRALGAEHQVLAWDIEEIDITERDRTLDLLCAEGPDLIVNTAAFVNLEACETDPDTAWRVNAVGAQNLALAARRANSALVYISTDYVFDGRSEVDYDEIDQPNPLNVYGRSKLAGERLSVQICPRTYAIRTAWLFGHTPGNYVDRVLRAAENEGVVRMPEDQRESPTYTRRAAEAIGHLVTTGAYGVYNVTSVGACTRADFARYVLEQSGRPEHVEVVDPATAKRYARRPSRVVLNCRLYQLVTGHSLPDWRQGIRDYLADALMA
jgi:dTDP-4-dehydrorhamnose reductase